MIIDTVELKRRYDQRIAGVRDNKAYIGPEILTLDITNTCNLNCHYCSAPHAPGNPAHFEKAKFFTWEDFIGIVRDAVDLQVDNVYLAGPGEPSIHPRFRDMMGYLEQQPVFVKLFTNATFLPDSCSDVIKGDHAVINFGAVDRQQYIDLKGKDLFDRVLANIKQLVFLRDTVKPGFRIELAYILNSVNIRQKEQMQDLARQLNVDAVNFVEMHEIAYNKDIALPGGSADREQKRTPEACLNGWFYMDIKLHENVSTCCKIHKMPFGDFDKGSFKNFWLSRRMMNLRLLGKYGQIQKMFKACAACPDYEKNVWRSQVVAKVGP